uniref:MATH domain-containing protein n=1 Tax=Setaria viridis TaxID=4556 RepID=A0A4V6D530_SETVI|nr:hypothetical protein SEVIR_6G055400v2 [Setaria viridis]
MDLFVKIRKTLLDEDDRDPGRPSTSQIDLLVYHHSHTTLDLISQPSTLAPTSLTCHVGAGSRPLLRSASAIAAKVARGFHRISSPFTACGRAWHLHYYPNGADAARPDSGSISFYLRLDDHEARVRAQYRLSLLGPSGDAAYELPTEHGPRRRRRLRPRPPEELGRGYADFISKEELERRRETLLKDDSLAVLELNGLYLGQRYRQRVPRLNYTDEEDSDDEKTPPRRQPDDRQYIRRCLAEQRHRA